MRAGVELLETSGPESLGLREIARRAGVSHGAPRRWFPTRQQLLAAIAREGLGDLTAVLTEALDAAGPVPERLLAAAHAYVGFARERPGMFRLIFRHDLLSGSGYALRELSVPLLGQLVGVITAGYPTMDDARERGVLLWTHVHGIATVAADLTLEPMGLDAGIGGLVERAVRGQLPA
ncbi:TetR/AcrR family transcriptional regulator [Kineosporia sp. J2-2]|uniref:TetR/AcrR family transcriptional regulator n=1 Tax=Kineosporia corallincola TaxID=2835133 RepID=A0ABS5TLI8_9ACTN|nr:TetR/AcrR family transcriptional regulator [Kineosporia corallincola]MBT0770469.1 TetR/AcrR family transcriptional regulator [Kineosporia corallincola]